MTNSPRTGSRGRRTAAHGVTGCHPWLVARARRFTSLPHGGSARPGPLSNIRSIVENVKRPWALSPRLDRLTHPESGNLTQKVLPAGTRPGGPMKRARIAVAAAGVAT